MRLIFVLLFILVSAACRAAIFPVLSALVNKDSVVLTWDSPQYREDGSSLDAKTEISHYNVFYGLKNSEAIATMIEAGNATTLTIGNLTPGVWEFAVEAVDTLGIQAELSNIVTSEIIFKSRPMASVLSGSVK